MDFILPLIVGLAIGAGALFLVTRRSASPALPTFDSTPQVDIASQVNHVVQSALSDALAALTEQSRRDREESIKLAADRVAEASGERFGKSAQQIDTSLRNVQEDIGRRIAEMDAEIATLRELHVPHATRPRVVHGREVSTRLICKVRRCNRTKFSRTIEARVHNGSSRTRDRAAKA
jgi:hypothetical protein